MNIKINTVDERLLVNEKFIMAYNEAVTADRKFEDTVKWCHSAHQELPKALKGEVLAFSLEYVNGLFLHDLDEAHRTKRELMRLIQAWLKRSGMIVKEGGAE